jgi:hypothetical protein
MARILARGGPIPKGRKGKIAPQNQGIVVFSRGGGVISLAPADFNETEPLI